MSVGRHFDYESVSPSKTPGDARPARFLGVHFACCGVYARLYPNRARTAYVGHCPKCAGRIAFRIGADGSDRRFFKAN